MTYMLLLNRALKLDEEIILFILFYLLICILGFGICLD